MRAATSVVVLVARLKARVSDVCWFEDLSGSESRERLGSQGCFGARRNLVFRDLGNGGVETAGE
jgi:hypothetical protein